ncbi:MAG: hypothetical protein KIT84_42975 [Labilithrix sp.]|nr:hypothetical protein [Labilithrix sp.]MCW5817843.1 hypothetical protein [Labilithrix sp.]
MARQTEGTTPAQIAAAYEAIVGLGDRGDLGAAAAEMRAEFQRRTGAYGPDDAWFENRSRAFWDDALTTQGFAVRAAEELGDAEQAIARCFARAHRGFFLVEEVDERRAHLVDAWSGAELMVRVIDETQALTLEHAEGPMDARVTSAPGTSDLFVLPGAYHHPADALEHAIDVLIEAKTRAYTTKDALDALLRMELVLRSSSRVKAPFAYRVENL